MPDRLWAALWCVALLSVCACAAGQPQGVLKGRRGISPWFVMQGQESIEGLMRNADIVDSISVCGGPVNALIEECHRLDIEVFILVGGHDGKIFATPEARRELIASYLQRLEETRADGIDLDFENIENEFRGGYSELLRELSKALHDAGKRLATSVSYVMNSWRNVDGPQPGIGGIEWYDPAVIGETCDMVRVMCYDMYSTSGKGIGPVSTAPWARDAMDFWATHVPKENLVMGLPAYSRDFTMKPGGTIDSLYQPTPALPEGVQAQRKWLAYEQINVYSYADAESVLHLFYASDTDSTRAHLRTVDELDLPAIGFWHYGAVTDETWAEVREWLKGPVE